VAWHSLTNFKPLHRTASAHERLVNGCAALDDGRFAGVGRDRTLRIWNRSYECITIRPPIKRSIRCVATSPQGMVIAVGSYDGHVARYDATTHQLLWLNRQTTVGISSIVFSVGHGAFLCSSYDGGVYSIPAGG
jgi:toxoflavin biosynthesis protein ToxC